MDFVNDLHLKAARERAWLIGDPVWMRQWLLDQAHRASSSALEFKSGYAARCRDMALRDGRAPDAKVGNLRWEEQPRVPAGNSILSGRWTRLAGDVPSPDRNEDLSPDKPPKLPEERPQTAKERNRIAKQMAKAGQRADIAVTILELIKNSAWAQEIRSSVESYWDEPKTLEELRNAVKKTSDPGYDDHHTVEQTPAEKDGHPRSLIDAPGNIVRIPRLKHWHITGWYQKPNDDFGGLTPREYLKSKSWEERMEVGLSALRKHGVLK